MNCKRFLVFNKLVELDNDCKRHRCSELIVVMAATLAKTAIPRGINLSRKRWINSSTNTNSTHHIIMAIIHELFSCTLPVSEKMALVVNGFGG
jgi:hypothetical protein